MRNPFTAYLLRDISWHLLQAGDGKAHHEADCMKEPAVHWSAQHALMQDQLVDALRWLLIPSRPEDGMAPAFSKVVLSDKILLYKSQ